MSVAKDQVDSLMFIALMLGTPFFLVFGWLSDKVGRKWIMMSGMLIAILAYRPIYKTMFSIGDLSGKTELTDQTKTTSALMPHSGGADSVYTTIRIFADGTEAKEIKKVHLSKSGETWVAAANSNPVITISKMITDSDKWKLIFLVFIQVIFVTMVYGPIAAFLVEMFPTKIRYTSMSLPYHIGNGVFGGLLPAVATYLVTQSKASNNPEFYLEGLWYPISVTAVSLIIGVIYIKNKKETIN